MASPRKVTCLLSGGISIGAELRQCPDFQILVFPRAQKTKSVRITINDTWPEANTLGTGLGKVRVFGQRHASSFQVFAYAMYDVQDGMAVQSATVEVINPGPEIRNGTLQVLQAGQLLSKVRLGIVPFQSVSRHNIWIPAPFETKSWSSVSRMKDPNSKPA